MDGRPAGLGALREAAAPRSGRDGGAGGRLRGAGGVPAGFSRASEGLGWVLGPSLGCPRRVVVPGRQGWGVRGKWRQLGWCWLWGEAEILL